MTKTGENLIAGRGGNLADNSSHHQPPARVLVVDDEPSALKLLCLILNTPAFHCTAANNGEEALVALHREHFDAVISDLCMPGIGGMEVLAEARRQDRHVAFVVTTGVDDVEVGVQAMRSGADDYLVKPLTESVVLASLERALHRKDLEQQVESYRQHLEQMVAERTAQLQSALQQTERSYEETLQALGPAIDLRDNETAAIRSASAATRSRLHGRWDGRAKIWRTFAARAFFASVSASSPECSHGLRSSAASPRIATCLPSRN